MSVTILRGDALNLPLADNSVDLVVTSPPYFGLRSYQDGGQHYDGQIGDEATPAEFVDALIAATAEMVRVLKPEGSIWVNLGDKYARSGGGGSGSSDGYLGRNGGSKKRHPLPAGEPSLGDAVSNVPPGRPATKATGAPEKSLIGVPWRYAIRCIDDLGLILRAEVIWSKPNGLPESVTDRVRRSHEVWFHFTKQPRYFSAVDEIREPHVAQSWRGGGRKITSDAMGAANRQGKHHGMSMDNWQHPLGKLPGSVWTIPTQPLRVPEHLGIDHFAAFPMEWPRRIIKGWSPSGICVECGFLLGAVRVPPLQRHDPDVRDALSCPNCGCGSFRPAVIADPFGGTGTTALVADVLGRDAIHIDLSADYCRLAEWRINDPAQRARAAHRPAPKPVPVHPEQGTLL